MERNYATQMDAARRGIVTPELKKVAEKEYMAVEDLMPLVASGKVAIPANKLHTCIDPEGIGSMLRTKINVCKNNSQFLLILRLKLFCFFPKDLYLSAIRMNQAKQSFKCGGFPGTISSNKSCNHPRLYFHRTVQRKTSVIFLQMTDFQHILVLHDHFKKISDFLIVQSTSSALHNCLLQIMFYFFELFFPHQVFICGCNVGSFSMNSDGKSLFFQIVVGFLHSQGTDLQFL